MTSPEPSGSIVVFSDFDGTISLQDTGCLIIDDRRCLGYARRRDLDDKVLNGEMSYRSASFKFLAGIDIILRESPQGTDIVGVIILKGSHLFHVGRLQHLMGRGLERT